jgi:hypothetical protein
MTQLSATSTIEYILVTFHFKGSLLQCNDMCQHTDTDSTPATLLMGIDGK